MLERGAVYLERLVEVLVDLDHQEEDQADHQHQEEEDQEDYQKEHALEVALLRLDS